MNAPFHQTVPKRSRETWTEITINYAAAYFESFHVNTIIYQNNGTS
jgi:hypothetical protein